jgi:hypothetical protein
MTNASLRPLTQEEEKFLRWTLEHGSDEARSYLPQIEGMLARRSCGCGCPSISLVVSDNALPAIAGKERIVVDLTGRSVEGASVGVLIFQDEGKLSELEIYSYGDEGEFGLPTIESIASFEGGKPVS